MNVVRMRFPRQALEELRRLDPETPVSLPMIRRLVKTGTIPSVVVGNGRRRLINFDALLDYLATPGSNTNVQQPQGIRRIDERSRLH